MSACKGSGSNPAPVTSPGDITSKTTRSYYELPTGLYPSNMVSRNGYLFWSERSQAPINKIMIAGGETTPVASVSGFIYDYAITAQYIFWIDAQNLTFGKSFIKKTSIDGRTTVVLVEKNVSTYNELYGVKALFVDDTNVFWVESIEDPDGTTSTSTIQHINKMPVDGGDIITLVSTTNGIRYLNGDSNNIYWTETTGDMNSVTSLHRIAKDGSSHTILLDGIDGITAKPLITNGEIYLGLAGGTDASGKETFALAKIPVSGGALQNIYTYSDYWSNDNSIRGLDVDSTNVYWIDLQDVKTILKTGGTVTTLVTGARWPNDPYVYLNQSIVAVGENVYWTETMSNSKGNLKSVPKAAGTVTALVQNGFFSRGLNSDSNNVYWIEEGGDTDTTIRIAELTISDGTISTLLAGVHSSPVNFALNNEAIFIADGEALKKVSPNGGKIDVIAAIAPGIHFQNVAADATYVYWLAESKLQRMPISGGAIETMSDGLVCDNVGHLNGSMFYGRYLYCVDVGSVSSAGTISRISLDSGLISTLATNVGFISEWTTDGTNVYYSDQDSGKVYKVSANGGAVTAMFKTNIMDITKLAADGQYLFWINQTNLAKTLINGGTTEHILTGLIKEGMGIAVDENNIYWSYNDLTSGGIFMATPK